MSVSMAEHRVAQAGSGVYGVKEGEKASEREID